MNRKARFTFGALTLAVISASAIISLSCAGGAKPTAQGQSAVATAVTATPTAAPTAPPTKQHDFTSLPANGAIEVPVDTLIRLTFPSTPKIGTSGRIKILDASDDSLVDVINLSDLVTPGINFKDSKIYRADIVSPETMKSYGFNTLVNVLGDWSEQYPALPAPEMIRVVNYKPLRVEENTLVIIPHNNRLRYGKTYYITLDAGAVVGYLAMTDKKALSFTVKKIAPKHKDLKVAADNSGDFATLQGALDSIPQFSTDAYTIKMANGIYREMVYSRNKSKITITGESRDGTLLVYDNSNNRNPGTGGGTAWSAKKASVTSANGDSLSFSFATYYEGGRAVALINKGDLFEMSNMTVQNDFGHGAQAEAIYYNDTGRFISKNATWLAKQDTINVKGYVWFKDCLVAGDVDFIWGSPNVALFEDCEIRMETSGGYIVQSRSIAGYPGFVFLNCKLTAADGVGNWTSFLARAGVEPNSTAYINCVIGKHIIPDGWMKSAKVLSASPVKGWREYGCITPEGLPVDTKDRPQANSMVLSEATYKTFFKDRATIFGGATDGTNTLSGFPGGWNPK